MDVDLVDDADVAATVGAAATPVVNLADVAPPVAASSGPSTVVATDWQRTRQVGEKVACSIRAFANAAATRTSCTVLTPYEHGHYIVTPCLDFAASRVTVAAVDVFELLAPPAVDEHGARTHPLHVAQRDLARATTLAARGGAASVLGDDTIMLWARHPP